LAFLLILLLHDLIHHISVLVLQSLVLHDLLIASLHANLALLLTLLVARLVRLEGISPLWRELSSSKAALMIEIFAVKDAFRTMSSHRILVLPVIFGFFDELLAPSYPSQSFISSGGKLRW
jgi:hypothetical protein